MKIKNVIPEHVAIKLIINGSNVKRFLSVLDESQVVLSVSSISQLANFYIIRHSRYMTDPQFEYDESIDLCDEHLRSALVQFKMIENDLMRYC